MKKKVLWTIIIIVIILIISAVAGYFILNKTTGFNFGFGGFDFSASSKALNSISEASNKNTFENVKLNPFRNSTG
mgnify:CR=1 FL=1